MKPPNFDGSMAINGTSQQPRSAPSSTTTTTTTTSTSTTPSPSRLPSGPVPRGAPSPPRGAVFNLDSVQRRIDSCLREAGLRQPYRQRICQSWSELLSEESSDGEEEEEVAALRALAIARNPTKANNGLLSNGFHGGGGGGQHRAPQSNSSSTVGTVSRRPYGSGKPPFRWTHNSISLDDDDGVDSDDSMEEFTSLPLLDIDLYGFHPSFDALITTRCICCSRIIQIGAFLQHMEKCHTYLLARILEAQDANLENFPHLLECLNAYVANQPSNGHARASTSNGLRPLGYHAHPDEKRLISVQSSERIKDLFDFTEEEDSESNSLMAKLDFALSSEDEEVLEEDEDEEGAVLPFTGHVPFVDLALDDNAFDALTLQEEDAIQEVEGDSTGALTESSDSGTGIQTEPGEGAGGRLTVAEVTGGGVTSGVRVRRRRRFSIRERGGSSLIARSGNAASSSTSPSFAWNHAYGAGGGGKGPLLTPAMNPEPVNSCEAGAVGGEEEATGGVKSATPMIIRSSRPPKDTVPKLTISWNRLQNGPSPITSARATVSPNSHCSSTSNSPLSSDSSKNSQASSHSSSSSLLGVLQAQPEVTPQLETPQSASTASKPVQQQPTTFANFTIIKGNYGGNILSSANQVKPAPVQPKKADQTGQQANASNTQSSLQERGGRSKVIQVNAPNKSTMPLASKSTNALVTAGTNSGQATGAPTKVMFKWVNESHLSPSGTLSTAEAKPLVAKKTLPTVTKVTLPSVTAVKRASPANASILGGKSLMLPSTMSLTGVGKTTTMTVIPGHSGKPLSMTTVSGMSTAAVIKSANGIPTGHFLIINPRPSVTSGGHPSNATSLAITLPAGATSRMLPNCTVNPSMIQPPPYQHRVNTQAPSNNTPNTTSFLPPLSAQIPIQTPLSSITPTLFTGATSYQDSPMPDQFEPDDEEEDPQVAAQKESVKLVDPSLTDYLDLEEILLSDLLSEDAAKKKAALNLQSTEMDSFLENILVQPKPPTPTTPKRESATPTLSAMFTEPSRVLIAQPDRVFSPKLAPGTFKTQPEIKLESEVEVKLESAHAPAEVKLESHPSTEIKLESGTFAEGDTPTEEELLQAMCELSTVSADDSAPNGTPGKKRPPRNRSKSTASDKKKIILCKNRTYTPDEHCGVQMAGMDRPCTRSLTCRSHMIALRRAVEGRSKPFDELLAEYRKERGMVDTRDRKRASRAKGKGTGEADSTAEQAEEEEEEGDYSQLDDLLSMDVSGESAKREVRRQSDLKMEYSDDDCSEVSLLSEASSSVAKAVSGAPSSSSFAHQQVKVESTQGVPAAELPKGNLLPAPVFASIHQPKKLSQGKTAPGGAPGSTSLTATSISLSALLDKPIYSPKSSSPGVVASLPSATLLSSIKASSPLVRRPSSSKFHTATSSSKPLLPITAASSAEIEVPDEALSRICLGPRSRQQVTLASVHSKATFSRSESSGDDELSSEEEELDEPSSEPESSSWPTPSNIIKSESPLYESSDSLFSEKSLFEEFQLNPDCFSAEAKSLTANRRRTFQLNVGFTRLGALALACRLKRRAAERLKGDGALSQASWIRISREVARKRARLRSKITKKRKRIKLTRRRRNQLASPLGPPRLSGAHEPPQTPMTPATPVTPAFPATPPVSASKTFLFSDSQPFGSLKVTPGKAITTSLAFPATAAQPGTRTLGTGGVTSRAGSTFWTGSLNNLPTTSSGAFTMLNPTFNSPPGSAGGMTTTAQLASPVKSSSPLQPTALMSLLNSKPVLRHAGSSSSSKSPVSREKHPAVSRNAVITLRKFPISVNIRSSTLEQLKNGPNFSQASVAAVSGPNDGQQSPFQKNRFDETSRIIENIKSELISSYEMKRRRSSFSQSASASASIPADGSNIRLIADGLTSSGVTLPRTVTRQHSLGSQSSRFSSTFSPVHDITVPSMEISKPSGNEVPEDIFNLIVDLEEGNCGEGTKRAVDGVTGKTLVTSVVSNEMATTALNPTPSPMDSDMEYLLSSSFQPNTSSAMVSVQQFGGTLSFVDSVKVTPPRAQEQPEQLQQPQQLQQMQQLRVQAQQAQPLQGNSQQAAALKLQMQPAANQPQQQVKVQQQQMQSQVVLQGQPSQAQQSVQPTVQQAQPSPSPITVTKVPGQLQPAQLAKLHQIRLQNKLKYEQQQAQLNRLIAQHQAQAQSGAPQTAQQLAQLTKLQQIRAQNKLKFEQQQTQLQRILLQHAQSTQLQQAQNQQQQQQQQAQVNQQGQPQQQQQQQVQVQFTSSPQQVQLPNQPQTMQITIQQPNQLRTNQFIQLQAGSGQQGQQVHVLQSGPQTNQASLQLQGQAAGSLLTAGQRTTGPIKISFAPQGANLRPKPKGPLAVATKSVASAPLSEKILVQCPSSLLPKQANEAVEVVHQQQQQQQQSIQQQQQQQQSQQAPVGPVNSAPKVAIFNGSLDNLRNTNTLKSLNNAISSAGLKLQRSHRTYAQGTTKQVTGQLVSSTSVMSGGGANEKTKFIIPITVSGTISGSTVTSNPKTGEVRMSPQGGQIHLQASSSNAGGTVTTTPTSAKLGGSSAFLPITLSSLSAGNQQAIILPITSLPHNGQNIYILHQGGGDHGQASVSGANNASSSSTPSNQTIQMATVQSTSGGGGGSGGSLAMSTVQQSIQQQQQQQTGATVPTGGTAAGSTPVQLQLSQGGQQFQLQFLSSPNSNPKQ